MHNRRIPSAIFGKQHDASTLHARGSSKSAFWWALLLVSSFACRSSFGQGRPYSVVDIGTLGGASSRAHAINNVGEVAGEADLNADDSHAFLFSHGRIKDLGVLPGGMYSRALGINDSRKIVGDDVSPDGDSRAILWNNGIPLNLGVIPGTDVPPGASAFAINNAGHAVGVSRYSKDDDSMHAFYYTGGSLQDMQTLGGLSSEADAINSANTIVGVSDVDFSSEPHAYISFGGGGMTDLGTFGGERSWGTAINDSTDLAGVIVTNGDYLGFVRVGGSVQYLSFGSGLYSWAEGININKQVVGYAAISASGTVRGFLWDTNNGIRNLQDLVPEDCPWTIIDASAINDHGQIAATGLSGGKIHALLLSPRGIGIDMSRSAGTPSSTFWAAVVDSGYAFVIAQGYGGLSQNPYAEYQLGQARASGLLTAGYCYLNFTSVKDGGCQVREALNAFGSEAPYIGFLAIDVEDKYLPPTMGSAERQKAIARIAEAVAEVESVGLRPVIYTTDYFWSLITGDSPSFSSLPLWFSKEDHLADLDTPSTDFGGWSQMSGKQYEIDLPGSPVRFLGVAVDYDIMDESLFARSNPDFSPPPLKLQAVRTRDHMTIYWADGDVTLEQSSALSSGWTTVANQTNPYEVFISGPTAGTGMLYRLKKN